MRPNFEQFKEAVAVFARDYEIVGHPELPVRTPWEEPNEAGVYSLTQVPEAMTEAEFLAQMAEVTDIVITCMDKDCAHSSWEMVNEEGRKVMMLTWGGGVVQHNIEGREGAVEAMSTIAQYLAGVAEEGKAPKLARIHCDDHDSVCGAVKAFLGGTPLHERLSEFLGRDVDEHSPEEDEVMEWFIRHGSQVFINAFASTDVRVLSHLHFTDRNDASNNRRDIIELGVGLPEMDVAAFVRMVEMRGR